VTHQRDLEQQRASQAWTCVLNVRDRGTNSKNQNYSGEYGSLARSAAADILTNGLGPALAFWYAKGYEKGKIKDGGNQHAQLLLDVSNWVMGQLKKYPAQAEELKGLGLLDWVVNVANTDGYRRATRESIAFLTWVKRFAEAELGDSEPG
jgi:CRISPR-associated protein Cmr5